MYIILVDISTSLTVTFFKERAMAEGKVIRVSEDVHARVVKIAKANWRGLGDQVRYWAETACTHPQATRIQLSIVVARVLEPVEEKPAQVGKGQPFRGFYCIKCRQYVLSTDADDIKAAEITEALGVMVLRKTK
jgi:hypothetical protein